VELKSHVLFSAVHGGWSNYWYSNHVSPDDDPLGSKNVGQFLYNKSCVHLLVDHLILYENARRNTYLYCAVKTKNYICWVHLFLLLYILEPRD
jgi:hypothetical protein